VQPQQEYDCEPFTILADKEMGIAKQLILQNTICFADSVQRAGTNQQLIDIEQNVLSHLDVIVGVIAEP